jgi:hypothetical protein
MIPIFPLILGVGLGVFTWGGLTVRGAIGEDIVPAPVEALALGLVFVFAALPHWWATVARALLPLPSFLLFLVIMTARTPPMPFGVAFICAGFYALFLTAFAAYIAEKSRLSSTLQ